MAMPNQERPARRSIRLPTHGVAFFALTVGTCVAADFEPFSGNVVDAESRSPLAGARVVGLASGRLAWTDSNGRFSLTAAPGPIDRRPLPRGVLGGHRLVLLGNGERFDWCSPVGTRRSLGRAPADIDPGVLPQDFGWIVSRRGANERRWSVLRVGSRVTVRETTGGISLATPPLSADPESLSVWLPGRSHRTVLSIDSARSVGLPPFRSVAGDFHTHTFLTDGSHTLDDVAAHAFGGAWRHRDANGNPAGDSAVSGFGLDWFVNSEHGGAFSRDRFGRSFAESPEIVFKGMPIGGYMWRWQSLRELSWPVVDSLREVYRDRHLFQGMEWNVPTHEHASVGIIARDPEPMARFEFFFDEVDTDTIGGPWPDVARKDRTSSHAKALAGARWLREHHRDSSWIVINHPSRLLRTSIKDLRDFHEAGGPVFLGIEAIPGHQKGYWRGGYSYLPDPPGDSVKARTFGGVDRMLAKVGGVMDAMWTEGRNVWVFANSDFHDVSGTDHYPGQYAKNLTRVTDRTEAGILAGLRSGATVAVMGDLVDSFSLELDDGTRTASMGQKLATRRDSVDVLLRFHVPSRNALGDSPIVDHVDLIRGGARDRIRSGDPSYSTDSVNGVSVIASVSIGEATRAADGWHHLLWRQPASRSGFFRIRGSSKPRGAAGWTDSIGNPLCDGHRIPNDDAMARSDLWFYSNPVFLERR